MFALICNGLVHELFEADPEFGDGFDVRDVSKVKGIAEGWTAAADGSFAAPETFTPTTVIPNVSSAQAKIQCLRTLGAESGKTLLDDITAAVQAAGGEAQIWFAEARTWERDNPYVENLSSGLKLKPADVDQLFIAAAQIAA